MPINKIVEDSKVDNAPATPTATTTTAAIVTAKPPKYVDNKKKKRGGFGLLKAAMLMLRGGKEARKSLLAKQNSSKASNANWKRLLGSVRPMPRSPLGSPLPAIAQSVVEDITIPTAAASPVASSSSSGTMSKYASASSLRDLDDDDEEDDDPDEVFDAIRGDELIDSKAEEFISQFYKQIKIQNSRSQHDLTLMDD